MAFTGFDPDPEITDPDDPYFGTGVWSYDDGTSMYGQGDPEQARALYKPAAPTSPAAPDPDGAGPAAPPAIARPPEPAPVNPPARAEEPEQTGGIAIPKSSRIAYVHNNPGNLKYVGQEGAHQGEPAEDGGHWAAFESPEEGVAALARQVELDAGRGQSVREFVTKYAPPGSNDTDTYIRQASEALGVSPDAKLSDVDRGKVLSFVARKESGTELGGTSLPAQSAAPPMPGLPRSFNGMPAAVAEVRGTPLSPEQIQQRQQGVYDSTMQQVAGVQQAAAERQRGREEALGIVQQQHDRFMKDQQSQLAAATAARAEAERNVQQAMATQLDPGRVIKNMSTGDVILGVIGLALGGLGQTLQQRGGQRGAQNMALGQLEKAIADDIEQQKEDKKSRVAHWTRVFNDQEMGIKAARAEMYNAAGQFAQFQAQQKATNADIQAQMLQDSQNLIAKGQAEVQGLVDKENERVSIRYQPPDPKGNGAADMLAQALKLDQALEQSGYSREQRTAMMARMGLPPPGGETAREQKTREDQEKVTRDEGKLSEPQAKAESAHQAVTNFATKAGLIRDPKTGKWIVGEGLVPPGFIESINPFDDNEISAALDAAVEGYGRQQSGGVIGKDERESFYEQLGRDTGNRAQLAARINAVEMNIESKRKQDIGAVRDGTVNMPPASWKGRR
jgi:hypothetical protein